MSKITDLLLDTMRHAEAGDQPGSTRISISCPQRHQRSLPRAAAGRASADARARRESVPDRRVRSASRSGMLMLGDRPPRSVDEAVAIGERLSALLMAEYLNREGTRAAPSTRAK